MDDAQRGFRRSPPMGETKLRSTSDHRYAHGCATAPESLEALVEEFGFKSLRIADTTRLFHPKLFLFHRRNVVPVAWIGSANFTYGGLAGNMELILELDDRHAVSAMLDWFNGWWMELKDQDSKGNYICN